MALKAFEEFAQEPLVFPIGGKLYEVPPVGYREGIRINAILAGSEDSLSEPQDGWRLVLGTAWDEMAADNVPLEAIARAGFAAMTDFQFGRDAAERVWESDPEALAVALTAAIEATTSPDSTPSPSTALGNRTQRRAASKRMTSPKSSKAKASQS